MAKQAKLVAAKEAKQQQRARRDLAEDAANCIGGAIAQYSSTKLFARTAGNRDTLQANAAAARSTRPPYASAVAKQDMRRGTAQNKRSCANDARYRDTPRKSVTTHRVLYRKTSICRNSKSRQPRRGQRLGPCAAKYVDQTTCTNTNGYAKDVVGLSSTTRTAAPNVQAALPQEERRTGQTKQPRSPKVYCPR